MNIYLITANIRPHKWDYYDRAVVCAPDEETARNIHPDGTVNLNWNLIERFPTWVRHPEEVSIYLLGTAVPDSLTGVICASFNAG